VSDRDLLHGAVVHGHIELEQIRLLVVGRPWPHLPCGTDPAAVIRECARRFAVLADLSLLELDAEQIERVVPFVTREEVVQATTERANRAQRTNRRKSAHVAEKHEKGGPE